MDLPIPLQISVLCLHVRGGREFQRPTHPSTMLIALERLTHGEKKCYASMLAIKK